MDYVQGMEDMYNIVKALYELPVDERVAKYRTSDVAQIIDRFNFAQLRTMHERKLQKYYVIRAIKATTCSKEVIAESIKLEFPPTDDMIKDFLSQHTDASFAVVEYIYCLGI